MDKLFLKMVEFTTINIIVGIVLLALVVFWIFMIVDLIRRKLEDDSDKFFWSLVILIPLIGAIVYYFVIFRKLSRDNPLEEKKKSVKEEVQKKVEKVDVGSKEETDSSQKI